MTTIKIDQHEVHLGSCLDVLPTIATATIDAIVTDPPYGLSNVNPAGITNAITEWATGNRSFVPDGKGFMGKDWDAFVPPPAVWDECMRVLKPGGHLLAFAGTRTQDLMGLAIRLAGFEIRDSIAWIYGSGFPKSHNLHGDWEGWGTALKPAHEPIIVARKPLVGTVAENVQRHGTGAINIAATRIPFRSEQDAASATPQGRVTSNASAGAAPDVDHGERREIDRPDNSGGRFPANVMLDEEAAAILDQQSEGASRFFYVAKASKSDRNEGLSELPLVERLPNYAGMQNMDGGRDRSRRNFHPTVKPTDLMRQLVRLVTPPGGTVLDPFTGSGTTGKAAILEGFTFLGIELTAEYLPIIEGRLKHAAAQQPEATLF